MPSRGWARDQTIPADRCADTIPARLHGHCPQQGKSFNLLNFAADIAYCSFSYEVILCAIKSTTNIPFLPLLFFSPIKINHTEITGDAFPWQWSLAITFWKGVHQDCDDEHQLGVERNSLPKLLRDAASWYHAFQYLLTDLSPSGFSSTPRQFMSRKQMKCVGEIILSKTFIKF